MPIAVPPRTAALVAMIAWTLAIATFVFDWQFGPGQQRVNVRWTSGITEVDRLAAERTLGLRGGEHVDGDTWVYGLANHSRDRIRQIVTSPRVADTAHIDPVGLHVILDAPGLPRLLRRFLETNLAIPLALCAAAIGLGTTWLARKLFAQRLEQLVTGPARLPRVASPVRPAFAHALPRRLSSMLLRVQDDWDWWAARAYSPLICGLLLLMTAYTAVQGRDMANDWDGWSIADWLITYADGFVRRGLSGELVLAASRASGSAPNLTAWATFTLAFATFCVLLGTLLWSRRVTFWFFVLCLSPSFLLFTFYNPDTVGRKDALLFAAVAGWILASRKAPPSWPRIISFSALAFALTLMHEMFFFFTPYFLIPSLVLEGQDRRRAWIRALTIPVVSGVAMVLLFLTSGSLTNPALCARLTSLGAPAAVCEGVLSYGHESLLMAWQDFLGAVNWSAVRSLLAAGLITLLPPAVFLVLSVSRGTVAIRLGLGVLAALASSVPLFVIAIDWGRWLAIHATLMTVVGTQFLPERGMRPYRPSASWRTALSLSTGALILTTMFTWGVKHCCRSTLLVSDAPRQAFDSLRQRIGF